MFIEKSLFDACHREDELRGGARLCLRDQAGYIDRRHRGIEVEVQRLLISRLAVTKTGELFSITEDEFDLKARFVKAQAVRG